MNPTKLREATRLLQFLSPYMGALAAVGVLFFAAGAAVGASAPSDAERLCDLEALSSQIEHYDDCDQFSTTTTTAVPPSTSPTLPSGGLGHSAVGVIGCSNTEDAVGGYFDISAEDNLINTAQGGVEIWEWANQSKRWARYDALRPAGGYDAAWINLCQKARSGPISSADVHAIVDRIGLRDPSIPVYVSPLNFYEDGLCPKNNGNQVPDQGAALIAGMPYLIGPTLGPLTAGMVTSELCHPNDAGEALLGAQLAAFFDGG